MLGSLGMSLHWGGDWRDSFHVVECVSLVVVNGESQNGLFVGFFLDFEPNHPLFAGHSRSELGSYLFCSQEALSEVLGLVSAELHREGLCLNALDEVLVIRQALVNSTCEIVTTESRH